MTRPLTPARRAILHRRVKVIVGVTISYNVLEAIVAIWAGSAASSAALIGFGLDSVLLLKDRFGTSIRSRDARRRDRSSLERRPLTL